MSAFTWRSPVEALLDRGRRVPTAVAYGATTYYSDLSTPRADRHVRVCGGTACLVASAGRHLAEVEAALGVGVGECSPDGRVSLQRVHCLGYCYGGPAALDAERPAVGADLVDQLIGRVPSVDPPIPVGSTGPAILTRPADPGRGWRVWASTAIRPDGDVKVRTEAARAGLRGRGGAAYPAARKWAAVAAAPADLRRFVVANGDEGDPGSYADRLLMERDPDLVLEGLALAALACGATKAYAYVRSEYPRARETMIRAVSAARDAGHLGHDVYGSGIDLDIEVVSGHGSYVAGEETSLLRAIEGVRGAVRPRPPYPTERGLFGYPTAVSNVETLATLPAIVADGGTAYAALDTPSETGTVLVSLSERFVRPGAYEVEFGTPIRELVDDLGGGLRDGAALRALQVGGPLGGFLGPDQLDVRLDEQSLAAEGLSVGHGGLVAVDERTAKADLLAQLWDFASAESCGACTPCREGTRRGARAPDRTSKDTHLLRTMEEASMCAFGQRVPAAIRSLTSLE